MTPRLKRVSEGWLSSTTCARPQGCISQAGRKLKWLDVELIRGSSEGPTPDPSGADHSMSLVRSWGGLLAKEGEVRLRFVGTPSGSGYTAEMVWAPWSLFSEPGPVAPPWISPPLVRIR